MNVITRKEALEAGLKRYFTGEPCKRGHIAERGVKDWKCVVCLRENHTAAERRRRKKAPEPYRAASRKWKQKHPEKARESEAKSRKTELGKILNARKGNNKEIDDGIVVSRAEAIALGIMCYFTGRPCKHGHVDKRFVIGNVCTECNRIRAAARLEKAENREKKRIYDAARNGADPEANRTRVSIWRKNNPEKKNAIERNRRARAKESGGTHSAADVAWLFEKQKGKCAHSWCRADLGDGYHVDHYLPLALDGANDRNNLQLLCPPCNIRKRDHHPIEWAQRNGMLL